ncbi:hypothetical protein [Ensifer canadensis]
MTRGLGGNLHISADRSEVRDNLQLQWIAVAVPLAYTVELFLRLILLLDIAEHSLAVAQRRVVS